MEILIIISVILLGLIFWSFWSVIFFRLWNRPTKKVRKWFLVWRSECPHCHHTLSTKNLVPIFSFLFQWWKCEYCKAPISWFYPFLEFTTVCIFWIIVYINYKYWIPLNQNFWLWWGIWCTICMAISAWLLRLILLYDIKTYELHITATVFLSVLSLFSTLFFSENKLQILLWIGIFALIFLWIYFLWRFIVYLKYKKNAEWFWFWDVILAPILWARLVFFLQPNWIFERCYLISFFVILSCILWLIYFWIEYLISRFIIIKKKSPLKWSKIIPFLPSMILWCLFEIWLRTYLINLL